jgi:hypothetical protein
MGAVIAVKTPPSNGAVFEEKAEDPPIGQWTVHKPLEKTKKG